MPYTDALLTTAEMAQADRLTIEAGTSGPALMARAGLAVSAEIRRRYAARPATVLCGPGNNGGDGFVVASHLARAGWRVRLGLLGGRKACGATHATTRRGGRRDRADHARNRRGRRPGRGRRFGSGLSRPFGGPAQQALRAASASGIPIIAIDVPSGLSGDSGADLGATRTELTITFFRKKPGHLLLPGRTLCGELAVRDVGIAPDVLDTIAPSCFENTEALWQHAMPSAAPGGNKFGRGHALLYGGGTMTGAARMAARAAARAGAGLTSIAVPAHAWPVYAGSLTSIMVRPLHAAGDLDPMLADARITGMLIGPGAGVTDETRARSRFPWLRTTPGRRDGPRRSGRTSSGARCNRAAEPIGGTTSRRSRNRSRGRFGPSRSAPSSSGWRTRVEAASRLGGVDDDARAKARRTRSPRGNVNRRLPLQPCHESPACHHPVIGLRPIDQGVQDVRTGPYR